MYDCLHLRFTLSASEAGYAAFQESRAVRLGTVTRQQADHWQLRYRNMRLDYWPATGRGRLRGSLHSFFHGHNSGVFTAADVPVACQALADAFGLPPAALLVEHLEVGVNLPLPEAPTAFLASLLAHKNSRFYALEPPLRATRPLLYGAAHHDYRIKAYDKGAYNRLQGTCPGSVVPHLLRFEVVYTRARPLQRLLACPQLTLAELARPATMGQLADALRQHWYAVEHRFEPDYTGLSLEDALLLHAATAPELWKAVRRTTAARTLSRHRARSRQLRHAAELQSPLADYHRRFDQQLAALLPERAEPLLQPVTSHAPQQPPLPHTWPAFHACNQVEPGSTSLCPLPSGSCPGQPTRRPSKTSPAPYTLARAGRPADDLRMTPRGPWPTRSSLVLLSCPVNLAPCQTPSNQKRPVVGLGRPAEPFHDPHSKSGNHTSPPRPTGQPNPVTARTSPAGPPCAPRGQANLHRPARPPPARFSTCRRAA